MYRCCSIGIASPSAGRPCRQGAHRLVAASSGLCLSSRFHSTVASEPIRSVSAKKLHPWFLRSLPFHNSLASLAREYASPYAEARRHLLQTITQEVDSRESKTGLFAGTQSCQSFATLGADVCGIVRAFRFRTDESASIAVPRKSAQIPERNIGPPSQGAIAWSKCTQVRQTLAYPRDRRRSTRHGGKPGWCFE